VCVCERALRSAAKLEEKHTAGRSSSGTKHHSSAASWPFFGVNVAARSEVDGAKENLCAERKEKQRDVIRENCADYG